MIKNGFFWDLVWSRFSIIGASRGEPRFRQLKLPLLGCAVAILAACSSTGSNQPLITTHSAPPPIVPENTQTLPPEFLTPKSELAVPDNPAVNTWVRRYSEDKHSSFQTQLDRARFYVVPVQQIFEDRGLPKDIVFVALVESGFTPTAKSHASAVGMWQFISATGKRFGLEQNEYVDERRHPFKSARAAADYLSFLYDMFHSWPLALAAYNCGENAVQGALVRSGLKSFWELAEYGYLPAETRDYVPKVLATIKIIRSPKQYGFYFDPKHYVQRHETIPVPGGVKLSVIEKKAGVPQSSLQECNPELCKPVTPPDCTSYELCVPVGMREMVASALAQGDLKEEKPAPKEERPTLKESEPPKTATSISCKVGRGETWYSLSKKYGCSPQLLALLNGTTPSHTLKAGQTLKVPSGHSVNASSRSAVKVASVQTLKTASGHAANSSFGQTVKTQSRQQPLVLAAVQKKSTPTQPSKLLEQIHSSTKNATAGKPQKINQPVRYPVRQGDTLWSISERFSVPVDVLCARNELKPNQKLVPGKLLTINSSK